MICFGGEKKILGVFLFKQYQLSDIKAIIIEDPGFRVEIKAKYLV